MKSGRFDGVFIIVFNALLSFGCEEHCVGAAWGQPLSHRPMRPFLLFAGLCGGKLSLYALISMSECSCYIQRRLLTLEKRQLKTDWPTARRLGSFRFSDGVTCKGIRVPPEIA
ncbi:hypothetical protein MXL79_16285 [Serratia ureilytica]|uniref:hypothetical protein n=1 Tax=Serratia ureilytica TaxID=300181 RepID=UPI002DB8D590|nr:hypothetical protein [Serratia ureilytica]MEB5994711.1 hypothetical protein [Serratia ureilytica]